MQPSDTRLEALPDDDTYRVIAPDGRYLGNIIESRTHPTDWLSQPVDMEQTTVWGCPTQDDAIQYLIDMYGKGVYVENEGE